MLKQKFNFFLLTIVITLIHFGATVLALFNGFTIFKGPTTTAEIFWYNVMQVLLFPSSRIFTGVYSDFIQLVVMILNSLLWGFAVAIFIVKVFKKKRYTKWQQ